MVVVTSELGQPGEREEKRKAHQKQGKEAFDGETQDSVRDIDWEREGKHICHTAGKNGVTQNNTGIVVFYRCLFLSLIFIFSFLATLTLPVHLFFFPGFGMFRVWPS